MRRKYITNEYITQNIYGTFNMREKVNNFSSIIMDIEDNITIFDSSIIYNQNQNNEQIDYGAELLLGNNIYYTGDSMFLNHTLKVDKSQSDSSRDSKCRWVMDINTKSILKEYIYASIKRSRAFEGVYKNMTIGNDVDLAINDYIQYNLLNRYRLSNFTLYIRYNDIINKSGLRFNNTWDSSVAIDEYILNGRSILEYENGIIVNFTQDKSSMSNNFNYYFKIEYNRI